MGRIRIPREGWCWLGLTAILWAAGVFKAIKRHYQVVIAVGGAVLIAMGVLVWSGELFQLNIQAQQAMNNLGINIFNI